MSTALCCFPELSLMNCRSQYQTDLDKFSTAKGQPNLHIEIFGLQSGWVTIKPSVLISGQLNHSLFYCYCKILTKFDQFSPKNMFSFKVISHLAI